MKASLRALLNYARGTLTPRRRPAHCRPTVESLEDRLVPAWYDGLFLSHFQLPRPAAPELNSVATTATNIDILLDFDGHYEPNFEGQAINTPAFDRDGDPLRFSEDEEVMIREIHGRVAEDFAPFNVNVTTVDRSDDPSRRVFRVTIGGDGQWYEDSIIDRELAPYHTPERIAEIKRLTVIPGVSSYLNWVRSDVPDVGFVFAGALGSAGQIADAASQVVGSAFGLRHQWVIEGEPKDPEGMIGSWDVIEGLNPSTGSGLAVDTDSAYLYYLNPGEDDKGPLMGRATTTNSERTTWWRGPALKKNFEHGAGSYVRFGIDSGKPAEDFRLHLAREGGVIMQQDMEILGGFLGWKADEDSDTLASARPLTPRVGPVVDPLAEPYSAGIIGYHTDRDYFRLDLTAPAVVHFSAGVVANGPNLDIRLELLNQAGFSMDTADPPDSLSASLEMTLVPGTYYFVVTTPGQYGDAGQYGIGYSMTPLVPEPSPFPGGSDDGGGTRMDSLIVGFDDNGTTSTTPTAGGDLWYSAPLAASSEPIADMDYSTSWQTAIDSALLTDSRWQQTQPLATNLFVSDASVGNIGSVEQDSLGLWSLEASSSLDLVISYLSPAA